MMNLYLRLLWAMIRGRTRTKMAATDELQRDMRVLPNDIDINMHMNNGRYLTIVDLCIVEYFIRTGMLKKMVKLGWRPMFGGHLVTYQKGLKCFERYKVVFSVAGMNSRWVFFRYAFVNEQGKVCAKGYAKGAAVSREGIVPLTTFTEKMGVELLDDDLPEDVHAWLEADASLREHIYDGLEQ